MMKMPMRRIKVFTTKAHSQRKAIMIEALNLTESYLRNWEEKMSFLMRKTFHLEQSFLIFELKSLIYREIKENWKVSWI
jgi:hypothetical protein